MKKWLALLLVGVLALSLAACGSDSEPTNRDEEPETEQTEKQTEEKPDNEQGEGENELLGGDQTSRSKTVTKSEWKQALDLSDDDNFTVTAVDECEEVWGSESETFGCTYTLRYVNGLLVGMGTSFYNDETETIDIRKTYEIDDLADLDGYLINHLESSGCFPELWYEFEDLNDLGYSLFTYSEEKQAYVAQIDIDGFPCDVTIAFEDGHLAEVTIAASAEDGDEYITLHIQCTFTAYGTTVIE